MKVILDPGKPTGVPGMGPPEGYYQEVKVELDDGDGNGAVVYVSEYRGRLLITVANGEANADQRGPEGIMIVDVAPEPYRGPAESGARVDAAYRS